MLQRLRARLLSAQTGRNQDLEYWWQLPDDSSRIASRWMQPFADFVAPAPLSEWHRRTATYRVVYYDGLRLPLWRAACLGVIAVALWVVGAPWWCWVMLLPAIAQFPLDVYLHTYAAPGVEGPPSRIGRWLTESARGNRHVKSVNAGGLAATLACPFNILAVCLAPSGGAAGWVKVAGLAAAVLFLNSALSQGFLDPPYYAETSAMAPLVHGLRPYASLISLSLVLASVWASIGLGRWEPGLAPVAMLVAGLTLFAGCAIRDHDRIIAAAAHVGREAVLAGREELGRIVHDDLNEAKVAAERASALPGIDVRDRTELQALSAFLTHFSTRVGMTAALRIDLCNLAEQISSPFGLGPRDIRCDIRWAADELRREDHQVAVRMATALIHNVLQQLTKVQYADVPKTFALEGFTSGAGRNVRYHLGISDHLPMIPADAWCAEGDTLAALRAWLREDYDGDLVQEDLGVHGKRIVASWHDRYQGESRAGDG